ncbi:MAG: YbfB/YjiJ family MFS transporter [Pseudomonadota bacterium]
MVKDRAPNPLALAIGGLIALAAAMGLGRFLYTPLLPLMAADAGLTPQQAGWIASANFAGYLLGALLAALPGLSSRAWIGMIAALAASGFTTGLMALDGPVWLWLLLRFAGGLASAFVLVFASALVVRRLQSTGHDALTAIHFAGVGTGILVSAVISAPWFFSAADWSQIWQTGAGLTVAVLLALLWLIPKGETSTRPVKQGKRDPHLWRLILSYGCLGFGYVITATFIVTILRESGASRTEETLIWALVGTAAIPSVALWSWAARRYGGIRMYQLAMGLEAIGVAISVLPGTSAMLLAALLLGGTFMALTALGFQEAAKRTPGDGRAIMALMTACFGVGQMIGPSLAGWLRDLTGSFTLPSLIAAAVLVFGALIVMPMGRAQPRGS